MPLLIALLAIPLGLLLYLLIAERLIHALPPRSRRRVRVAAWIAPAVVAIVGMLVYPVIETMRLSLFDAKTGAFGGLGNFIDVLSRPSIWIALRNNLLWVVFFTGFVTVLGLVVSALGDRVRYERVVWSIVVLPTAISFVGAGVIWGFMYDYSPPGVAQTGTLNAIWTALGPGADPIAWLSDPRTNNGALIFIGIWMATGFACVILSAALKSVPIDTIEAARMDGAREHQVFFRIVLPQIQPAIAVVVTLMAISALKIFDIIYVLTNGNFDTQVLATSMYSELFASRDAGTASAIAVLLLLFTLPVVLVNLRAFRRQEELR
ncbi:carbohydrate ABC transporter permease [Agromyces bauzanensis]